MMAEKSEAAKPVETKEAAESDKVETRAETCAETRAAAAADKVEAGGADAGSKARAENAEEGKEVTR